MEEPIRTAIEVDGNLEEFLTYTTNPEPGLDHGEPMKAKQSEAGYRVLCQTGETNAINATANGLTLTVNPGQQSAFNSLPDALRGMLASGLVPQDIRIGVVVGGFIRELVTGDRFWSKSGKWLGKSHRREAAVEL